MGQKFDGSPIAVFAVGKTQTTGAASASVTLPVCLSGENPRYVRIAATVESYVKLGPSAVAATTNDILVQPADSLILQVSGATYIAYIQGATTGKVNILALENM